MGNRGSRRVWIEPYGGVGDARRLQVLGRVWRGDPPERVLARRSWWRNLVSIVHRMISRGAAGVTVATPEDHEASAVTDREGYFELDVAAPVAASRTGDIAVTLHIAEDARQVTGSPARTIVPRPGPRTERLIVSDVDDTLLPMAAYGWLRAMITVLFGDAFSRRPFPGVGPFFRGLRDGANGVHRNLHYYVSSSPWNVYGILIEFLRVQEIPFDALFLRSWRGRFLPRPPRTHRTHKRRHIDRILRCNEGIPVILVGDSSAEDPEIYRDVVERHPGRVAAIYIRDVGRGGRASRIAELAAQCRSSGTVLLLAPDTGPMAEHAARNGWISDHACAQVRAELEK